MNFSKNLFPLEYIIAAILDEKSNNFQRQFTFIDLLINGKENGRRCMWNATCKQKFRTDFVKKTEGTFPLRYETIPFREWIYVYVQEKINILLSISSHYCLLYFDICLNIQRFV